MFDLETFCIVRDLVRDSAGGESYLNIRPYLQRYALNTTLTLCYGIRMDSVWDDMLREVLEGRPISLVASLGPWLTTFVLISWQRHFTPQKCV